MSVTTGYIFNNKDSNSLFDKIEKVLLLDRTEVAREVQDIFQKHYTAKKNVFCLIKTHILVYDTLCIYYNHNKESFQIYHGDH